MRRTEQEIADIMRKVKSRDTNPERQFRKALWAKGLRYKISPDNLPGKPDVVLPSRKLVIFIDGDYWHGNQWVGRGLDSLEGQFQSSASAKKEYWVEKIRGNMARDSERTTDLIDQGWKVLRFWESDIKKNLEGCVEMAVRVAENGASYDTGNRIPEKSFAEFFAGIGLMRLGLEKEGWNISCANDIDEQKYEMYRYHFEDADKHFLVEDIHKLKGDDVPSVTLATASFPCNDLSLAGSRSGLHGKESSTFWEFTRILKEMGERKPSLVLLENVTGFLSSHRGEDFKSALLILNDLGYAVDAFILNAARFVPQSRLRLFVVGALDEGSERPGFHLDSYESDVRPRALAEFIQKHPEIKWNIRPLPEQPHSLDKLPDILEDLDDDAPEWWNQERADYLLNQMSPRHRKLADQMIAGKEYSFGTVFRRIRNKKSMAELRTDGIAGCLRTPRGGSGRQILFKAGKGTYQARLLTPRECARLMGANEFALDKNMPLNQALFGFGDAVCVPVISWIARYYLNPVVNEMLRGVPLFLTVK